MPQKTKHRLVIDTNIWVSYLLTKNFNALDNLFSSNKIVLLFSNELIDEFIEVARRPKFKKYFSITVLETLLTEINNKAEFVETFTIIDLCRDENDNFLLSLAVDGNANYLITGDKNLLILKQISKTKIVTFPEYFSLL